MLKVYWLDRPLSLYNEENVLNYSRLDQMSEALIEALQFLPTIAVTESE